MCLVFGLRDGGGGDVLEDLGGWVSKHPPLSRGAGTFLGVWVLMGSRQGRIKVGGWVPVTLLLSCTFLVPFCYMFPLQRTMHAWLCGFVVCTKVN